MLRSAAFPVPRNPRLPEFLISPVPQPHERETKHQASQCASVSQARAPSWYRRLERVLKGRGWRCRGSMRTVNWGGRAKFSDESIATPRQGLDVERVFGRIG